eukprot:GHVT01031987.1.p1 GENE.GHVT01031987.1~~GHVT01031987.1.p1  ORF type:complete len:197 (-),score=37.45 GHVT01031987.1:1141-1731(-)
MKTRPGATKEGVDQLLGQKRPARNKERPWPRFHWAAATQCTVGRSLRRRHPPRGEGSQTPAVPRAGTWPEGTRVGLRAVASLAVGRVPRGSGGRARGASGQTTWPGASAQPPRTAEAAANTNEAAPHSLSQAALCCSAERGAAPAHCSHGLKLRRLLSLVVWRLAKTLQTRRSGAEGGCSCLPAPAKEPTQTCGFG